MNFRPHFSPHSEGARDLKLVLLWLAALLVAGSAANIFAIWYGAGQ